jgi:hypothetical protein
VSAHHSVESNRHASTDSPCDRPSNRENVNRSCRAGPCAGRAGPCAGSAGPRPARAGPRPAHPDRAPYRAAGPRAGARASRLSPRFPPSMGTQHLSPSPSRC